MIQIKFDPDKLPPEIKIEWEQWIQQAEKATNDVIDEWVKWKAVWNKWAARWRGKDPVKAAKHEPKFSPTFDEAVWKGFRDWLKKHVFHDKCAYCETKFARFIPDTEHFRPKRQVRGSAEGGELESTIVLITDENGEKLKHPGYFWLAYNWKNLLPSCHKCNRYGGKKDQFPATTHVAVIRLTTKQIKSLKYQITKQKDAEDIFFLEPEDLDVIEGRQLLHPYFDDPRKHLVFGMDGSVMAKKGSAMGPETIRVFALDDPEMTELRKAQQNSADNAYLIGLAAVKSLAEKQDAARKVLREYVDGPLPYAASVIAYLHTEFKNSPLDPVRLIAKGLDP